jgi:hypothetical protein
MAYGNKDKNRTCHNCNCEFRSYKKTTKFCSAKCNNDHLYKERNIEAHNERKRNYQRETGKLKDYKRNRYQNDICFKAKEILRARLNMAIRRSHKSGSAVRDLGCSVSSLKRHLEAQFKPGMSWDNWPRNGWHVDHIKPLSAFDLTDPKQVKEACHYSNLQPLWASDNISKGGV